MNSTPWLHHFQRHADDAPEPDWTLPCPESPVVRRHLARSFAHFQLGETGEGASLLAFARAQTPPGEDPDGEAALACFVREEQRHVRWLGRLVEHLGGTPVTHHWTHSVFRRVRHALGLRFELQTILICELVGTAWFRCVRDHTIDRVVTQTCTRLLQDEAAHVAFHADRFRHHLAGLLPWERTLWRAQFQLLFHLAAAVCWLDHARCLNALGVSSATFHGAARRETIRFLDRLAPATKPRWRARATPLSPVPGAD